jgi:hypothetical protein
VQFPMKIQGLVVQESFTCTVVGLITSMAEEFPQGTVTIAGSFRTIVGGVTSKNV